jgi:hypothetical protein
MLVNERRSTDSIEERNRIREQEMILLTKIRSIEKFLQRTSVDIGEYFILKLNESVNALTVTNITVCTALFQADAVMASNILKYNADVILTSDSDQAAILGEACICIKQFKLNDHKQTICCCKME